jgi:hypothetical protein
MPWTIRYAYPGRIPYVSWETPVPRLNDNFPKIAIYLYPSVQNAETGDAIGGSGFLLMVPSRQFAPDVYLYAVTNRHVIEHGCCVLRMNRRQGAPRILELEESDWILSDDDDLAVHFLNADKDADAVYLSLKNFVEEKDLVEHPAIGIGDEVVYMGRFMPHERIAGLLRNEPTARFGHISLVPSGPLRGEDGKEQEAILIETHSIAGYSGSPVFYFQRYEVTPQNRVLDHVSEMKFLGIDYAHLPQYAEVLLPDGSPHPSGLTVETGSGMMAIIPAWRLRRFLDDPRVLAPLLKRDAERALWNKFGAILDDGN